MLSLIIFYAFFLLSPVFTGKVIGENTVLDIIVLNESFDDSTVYIINLSHAPNSVRLTGYIVGEGTVKVYLGELLVLDSDGLKGSNSNLVTGYAIEDAIQNEPNESADSEQSDSNVNITGVAEQNNVIKDEMDEENIPQNATAHEEPAYEHANISAELINETISGTDLTVYENSTIKEISDANSTSIITEPTEETILDEE
jgi:hypothetical protein